MTDSVLEIRQLTPKIGAEIRGVALSGNLPPATVTAIRDALLRHRVVFFRGQTQLDEAGQQAFGRLLGPIVAHPTAPPVDGTEVVLDIDGTQNRASSWHTDVAFVDAFPQFSILRGVVVPPLGGDTVWANTVAAYESLPEPLRAAVDKLWALHTNAYDYAGSRPQATSSQSRYHEEVIKSTVYETEHPVVQVHPATGERALILGHHIQRLIGLSGLDSARLLNILHDHATKLEHTVRWRWTVGDLVIWDDRATLHRAIDDYGEQPRVLRRVTVAGPVGVGIDGARSVLRKGPPQIAAAA
jgi:alpha-ketoglutarate-dependent sulfate ester dioxygenase